LCIIILANYSTLFKEVYDYMFNVLPKHDLYDILDEMRTGNVLDDMRTGNELRGYVQNRRTHIAGNDLLMVPFKHGKSYSFIPPANTPGQTCLRVGERMVRDLLGISRVNKNTLTPQEFDQSQPLQFLVFLRHRPAHRMDPYQGW